MQRYYPELAGTSHYAVLYVNEKLTPVWCREGGWTQILLNEQLINMSTLTLTDYA